MQTAFATANKRSNSGRKRTRDGTPVVVRPVRESDSNALVRFLNKIAPEDVRLKFFGAQNFTAATVRKILRTDTRKTIFVALDEMSDEVLGFAKLHQKANNAEFAILVRSDLKNHGFGWLLMQALLEHAKANGVHQINGDVLACNANMLRMCKELGFIVSPCPDDPQVRLVTLGLKI